MNNIEVYPGGVPQGSRCMGGGAYEYVATRPYTSPVKFWEKLILGHRTKIRLKTALMQHNFQHDYREALFHLYKYAGITVSATASLEKAIAVLDKDIVDPLYFITFSQVMLILDNYLVEYDSFLQSSDSVIGERIRNFKVIVQPAISTLRRWDGLHSFRNHVLAHSFRLKSDGNKSVFRDGDYYLYDIPQNCP